MADDNNKSFVVLKPIKNSSGLSMLNPSICHCEPDYNVGDHIKVTIKDGFVRALQVTGLSFRPYVELLKTFEEADSDINIIVYKDQKTDVYGENPWTWCYVCKSDDWLDSKLIQ